MDFAECSPDFGECGQLNQVSFEILHTDPPYECEENDAPVLSEVIHRLRDIQCRLHQLETSHGPGHYEPIKKSEESKFYHWMKQIYRSRMLRRETFNLDYLIGEPCWDMLLDLSISKIEERRVSITSVCIASGVPPTTALRWISLLERDGFVEKCADKSDKRRTFVAITKKGHAAMFDHFKRATA